MILKDKTVLVCGVGAGLGREVAERVLAQGGRLVMAARTESVLAQTAKELDASGERVTYHPADISRAEDCAALVAHARERFGAVDALIDVAAFEQSFGGVLEADLEAWRTAYEVNVLGAVQLVRAVHPVMKEAGGGSIVLIGSQSMFKPSMPQGGYAASKGGLLTAMYYMADELGPDNIRANMVIPSWMWGPPVQGWIGFQAKDSGRSETEVLDDIVGRFPLRRMTEDGEVADAAVFFASDLAKAVTGQYLMVNSGELLA